MNSDSTTFSLQDSAGVSFVTNAGPDQPLEVGEILRFGVVEGDPTLQFDGIRSLAVDSAGGIWVCDSHESIRYYDDSGTYQKEIGGLGEGPGEAPSGWGAIWMSSHSLLAYAFGSRLQLFDFDGNPIGSRSFIAGPLQQLIPIGPAGDRWLFRRTEFPESSEPPYWMRWTIGQGPGDSAGFDSLVVLNGEILAKTPADLGWGNGSYFDGTHSISVDGQGRIHYSHHLDYRIEVYSPSGDLERVILREVNRRPYTDGLRDEIEDGVRAAYKQRMPSGSVSEEQVQAQVDDALATSDPAYLPALDLILTSNDGHIWAQRADTHPRPAMRAVAAVFGWVRHAWLEEWKAPRHFDLFTPAGAYRGTVLLPVDFSPMVVTADRVYGIMIDSLDVQYVSAFSIGSER